jgi:hypothetical protein
VAVVLAFTRNFILTTFSVFFSSMYLSGKLKKVRNYYLTLRQHNGAWLGRRLESVQRYLVYIYLGDQRLRPGIGRPVSLFNSLTLYNHLCK